MFTFLDMFRYPCNSERVVDQNNGFHITCISTYTHLNAVCLSLCVCDSDKKNFQQFFYVGRAAGEHVFAELESTNSSHTVTGTFLAF